ncbi:MAG: NnrS family protein, partial [Candidatus Eiseniibacteriota bacterium]
VLGVLVWKLFRTPGRRAPLSWTIWGAGWMVLLGLWLAALAPARAVLAFHLVSLGGFGPLVLGIATRVVVTHGGYPAGDENRVLHWGIVGAVVLALIFRVASEIFPHDGARFYAAGGASWILGWVAWCWNAIPRMVRRAGKPIVPDDHPQRILLQRR